MRVGFDRWGRDFKCGGKNNMVDRLTIAPTSRNELERVVVRLLEIAGRSVDDPATQRELMQLADELVKITDEIK